MTPFANEPLLELRRAPVARERPAPRWPRSTPAAAACLV
jgi:hypothetical protein